MLLLSTAVLSFIHHHTTVSFRSRPHVMVRMSTEPPEGTLESIRSAARMGNVDALQELIADWNKHPILNERRGDILGLAPIHWAVAAGQAKGRNACVQLLIDSGAGSSSFSPPIIILEIIHTCCHFIAYPCYPHVTLCRYRNSE